MKRNPNYYQSIVNQNKSQTTKNQNYDINEKITENQKAEPIQKTDKQFFNNLFHYNPLCYSGHGSPLFMLNKTWYLSLGCTMVMNGIFILVILVFLKNANQGIKPMSQQSIRKYTIVNISLMVAMNITYVLTQFLNPGVRNLSNIQPQQYEKDGKVFCDQCRNYRTQRIQHCPDCKVCIDGLDHHCGFFNKCIGGCQKYAFYSFICISFLGFFSLIISMTANLGL